MIDEALEPIYKRATACELPIPPLFLASEGQVVARFCCHYWITRRTNILSKIDKRRNKDNENKTKVFQNFL
ncbi:hypothetical protein DEM91_09885 [Prevotella sp. TCVGH]|nr:hypothetical protein [Prevotella sp. TCVGH]